MLIVRVCVCVCFNLSACHAQFQLIGSDRRCFRTSFFIFCSYIRGLKNFFLIHKLLCEQKNDHSENINAFQLMHAIMIYTTAYNDSLSRFASVTTSTVYLQCWFFLFHFFQHTGVSIKPHIHFIFFLPLLLFFHGIFYHSNIYALQMNIHYNFVIVWLYFCK